MPFLNGFPYTDYDQINLDWVIKTCKEALDKAVESLGIANDTKAYVDDYFDNLDVQQEINNKIDQMADDGDLLALMSDTITDVINSWLTLHITNPSNPPLDTSLSLAAAAAPAKTVGDLIYEGRDPSENTPKIQTFVSSADVTSDLTMPANSITYASGSNMASLLTNFSDSLTAAQTYILEKVQLSSLGGMRFRLYDYTGQNMWYGSKTAGASVPTWYKVREPFVTDTTLTQAGMAADAKAVGDLIYEGRDPSENTPKIQTFVSSADVTSDLTMPANAVTYASGSNMASLLTNFSDSLTAAQTYILEKVQLTSLGGMRFKLYDYTGRHMWYGSKTAGASVPTWYKVREPATYDRTLRIPNMAPDSAAAGKLIRQSAGLIVDNIAQWSIGSIRYNIGDNSTGSTKIRTATGAYIDSNAVQIFSDNMVICAYVYARDKTYIGVWNGSTFVKNGQHWFSTINLYDVLADAAAAGYPHALLRLVAKWPDDRATAAEDGANIYASFYDIPFGTIASYDRVGVCGASYDSGYYSGVPHFNRAWPKLLSDQYGFTLANYSYSGYRADTFISQADTGVHQGHTYTAMMADTPCDLYILTFGGNDAQYFHNNPGATYKLGTIADIADYGNVTTFYSCYGHIIDGILSINPDARIVITTPSSPWYSAEQSAVDGAVAEIAAHYSIPMISWEDDGFMGSSQFVDGLISSHPSPFTYAGMAEAFKRLFCKCSRAYFSYFNVLPS